MLIDLGIHVCAGHVHDSTPYRTSMILGSCYETLISSPDCCLDYDLGDARKNVLASTVDADVTWTVRRESAGARGADRFRLRASNQGKRAGAGKRPP